MFSCEKATISFQSRASKACRLGSLVDSVAVLPLLSVTYAAAAQHSLNTWLLHVHPLQGIQIFCMYTNSRFYRSSNALPPDDELSSLLRILGIWGRGSVCPSTAPESLWLLHPVLIHYPLTCSWCSPFCLLLNKLSIF